MLELGSIKSAQPEGERPGENCKLKPESGTVQRSTSPLFEKGSEMPAGGAAKVSHCQLTGIGCSLRTGPGKVSSTACARGTPDI